MIICTACGGEVVDDARFCSHCGERIQLAESTTTMPVLEETTLTNELNSEDIAAIEALPHGSVLLIVLRGPATGARFLLNQSQTIAGRAPESGIFLDDITVSRAHVCFTIVGDTVTIEDLGSLNGTYVNRSLLKDPAPLRNGDEVQIGKFKMVVFLGSSGQE
ncbi:MAG: zinc-ribbon and FHA domain-containing protein [Propionibacteriaceae bacterium]|jgi:pSer/pThr/pTyr-binding forkhead associated (FHA) protein|nr:zinc-ribbon and FHA domain-containing protein [Propionibacteriaceae bacterium]